MGGFKKKKNSSPHLIAKFLSSIMKRGDFSGMTDRVCWLHLSCEILGPWNDERIHKEMLPQDLGSHGFPGAAALILGEFASLW